MKLAFAALLFFVPNFASIQTDGVVSEGEWNGAEQTDVGNGNSVLLKRENDVLFVALRSATVPVWSHLYLSDGKRVKVMHASAALGAINYKLADGLWRTDDKSFCVRIA